MAKFASWLINQIIPWAIKICNVFIDATQGTMDALVEFIIFIVTLFPQGSMAPSEGAAPVNDIMSITVTTLNWLFPVSFLVSSVLWLVTGMLLYIVISPLARWAKLLS